MTDLPDQPMSAPPPRTARPGSAAWVAVLAAAAVVLAAVALTQNWFGGAAESSPSPTIAASVQAEISPSPGPSGAQRPSIGSGVGVDWTTVATLPGASASDVTAGGPGWVAVGAEGEVGCEICPGIETYTSKIWASTDGRTWDEVSTPGLEGSTLSVVAAGPAGLVAIGWQAVDGASLQQVVTSPDGATWTRIAGTPFETPGTSVHDIVGGDMYLAVGVSGEPGQDVHPTMWTSSSGRDWTEAYRSPETGAVYHITEVLYGWIAVGEVYRPLTGSGREYVPFPVMWEFDGQTWSQQDLPLGTKSGAGSAQDVMEAGLGFVAVGYAEYAPPEPAGPALGFAAWHSIGGASWGAAPVTADFLEDIGGGHLLYEAGGRVFAIGSGCRCGTGWPGRWWTTPDGRAWTEHLEIPPILYAVIPFDGGLLGVGLENGEGAIFISE